MGYVRSGRRIHDLTCEGCGEDFQASRVLRFCSRQCSNSRPRSRRDPLELWWSNVDRRGPDECWPWTAGRDKDGYGKFSPTVAENKQAHTRAHRFGYEQLVGPIPEGYFVCHTCDNPPCCNPAHWFAGTVTDNNRDKITKGREANQRDQLGRYAAPA